ncbi:MAG: hypothetical protein M1817_005744 [Caeruleum heppii]|nr:MAG: hypothetical protein M1817_005744 [Caeruleum heppii]
MLLRSGHRSHTPHKPADKPTAREAPQAAPKRKRADTLDTRPHKSATLLDLGPQDSVEVPYDARSSSEAAPPRPPELSPPLNHNLQAPASPSTANSSLKQVPLTKKNLRMHTKNTTTRPTAAATSDDVVRSSMPTTATKITTINTTTTTTAGYHLRIQLRKNRVVLNLSLTMPPKDLSEVEQYLDTPRDSPPPDATTFQAFQEMSAGGPNELTCQCNFWPLFAQPKWKTRTSGYNTCYNVQWVDLDSTITKRISDPKPDISESLTFDQYPPEAVETLGSALIPTRHGSAMPRLCVEWKGSSGSMAQAEAQCGYDGALMVEAAHKVHQYLDKPDFGFLDHTQALTIAMNSDQVYLYANHAILVDSAIQYHQYRLYVNNPITSIADFHATYRRIRNAQDWARERALETRDLLKTLEDSRPEGPRVAPTAQAVIERAMAGSVAKPPDTASPEPLDNVKTGSK